MTYDNPPIVWTRSNRYESPARHCALITPSGIRYTLFSLATRHEDSEDVQFRIMIDETTLYEHQHDVEIHGDLPDSERRAIREGIKHLLSGSAESATKTAIMWCSHMAVPFTITTYVRPNDTHHHWKINWLERDTDLQRQFGSETTGERCYGWRSAMASAIASCMCD